MLNIFEIPYIFHVIVVLCRAHEQLHNGNACIMLFDEAFCRARVRGIWKKHTYCGFFHANYKPNCSPVDFHTSLAIRNGRSCRQFSIVLYLVGNMKKSEASSVLVIGFSHVCLVVIQLLAFQVKLCFRFFLTLVHTSFSLICFRWVNNLINL